MMRQPFHTAHPQTGRVRMTLLLLVLLSGLVAMHGLGAAGFAQPSHMASHSAPASEASENAMPPQVQDATGACEHPDRDGSRHVGHADPACSAAGTGAAPVLPSLSSAMGPAALDETEVGAPPATVFRGRAPPTLSELQLLRI